MQKIQIKQEAAIDQQTLIDVQTPATITDTELFGTSYPEPEFVIPGIFPQGLIILAGKPKVGKSILALDMAFSVASGGQFLGIIEVEPRAVLYIALEDSKRRLKSRLSKMTADPVGTDMLHIGTKWPRLDKGFVEALKNWLVQHNQVKLVIVDTFNKIRGFNRSGSSPYEKDYYEIAELKGLADEHKLTMILVHHLRKSAAADMLDTVSGSIGLTGAADTIAIMEKARGDGNATLYITGRDVEEKFLPLKFNKTALSWEILQATENMSPERVEILEILRQASEPLKLAQIAETVSKQKNTVHKLLAGLIDSGNVEKTGYGSYKAVVEETPNTATGETGENGESGETSSEG